MPYVSEKQRRFFHSKGAAKAGISQETVAEFDKASKGKDLPEDAEEEKKRKRKAFAEALLNSRKGK